MKKDAGKNYKPYCKCSVTALEPNDKCWLHGCPLITKCPYCGSFRSYNKPCKRCGCTYGIIKES